MSAGSPLEKANVTPLRQEGRAGQGGESGFLTQEGKINGCSARYRPNGTATVVLQDVIGPHPAIKQPCSIVRLSILASALSLLGRQWPGTCKITINYCTGSGFLNARHMRPMSIYVTTGACLDEAIYPNVTRKYLLLLGL